MKHATIPIGLLLILLLGTGTGVIAAATDGIPTIPLEEIQSGMRGTALSCFKGTDPERFDVEIVGILHGSPPGSGKIIGRVITGPAAEKGIMSGMSGSPLYIGGRLAGALSFSFPYAREPLVGITAIGDMIRIWTDPPPQLPGRRIFHAATQLIPAPGIDRAGMPVPIQMPLVCTGMPLGYIQELGSQPRLAGILPMQGGHTGSSVDSSAEKKFVPGGVMGCAVVHGDLQLAGLGTITARTGTRVIGFGHSMYQLGHCDLPMVGGDVVGVVSNIANSFKLFNTGAITGRITHDFQDAVAGVLGEPSPMIPVTVTLQRDDKPVTSYHFQVFNEETMAGTFLAIATGGLLFDFGPASGNMSADVDVRVEMDGLPALIIRREIGYLSSILTSLFQVLQPLEILITNPIRPVKIANVEIDIRLNEHLSVAEARDITILDTEVTAGQTVHGTIRIAGYRMDPELRTWNLDIPANLPPGTYRVGIYDAQKYNTVIAGHDLPLMQYDRLPDLIHAMNKRQPANQLHLVLTKKQTDMRVHSRILPNPPVSMESILGSEFSGAEKKPVFVILSEKTLEFPFHVTGNTELEIRVVHPDAR